MEVGVTQGTVPHRAGADGAADAVGAAGADTADGADISNGPGIADGADADNRTLRIDGIDAEQADLDREPVLRNLAGREVAPGEVSGDPVRDDVPKDVGDGEDATLPELSSATWLHHAETVADTRFWAVARRLPQIVRAALHVAWQASPRDTMAAIALNVLAGVLTTFGLLATSSVLRELFSVAPTADRVRAALPSLVLSALAAVGHGGLTIAAGWAQSRLEPQINY